MSNFLNVGLAQLASFSTNPDLAARKRENLGKLASCVSSLSFCNPGLDLIVFPELYVDGYDPANWQELAETIPGPCTDVFCTLAKQHRKWLVPGSIAETCPTGGTYNTTMLISPEGEIVLRYRKIFIPYPLEPSVPGDDLPVFDIPNVCRIGLLICSDAHIPEIARNLALKGAEVLIKPTFQGSWIGGVRNLVPICQTRAVENQCFVVSVNQAAPPGMGHSCVCDPEARVLEELEAAESAVIVSLNLDEVRRVRETGFMGVFPLFKLLRDLKDDGKPVDECYVNGIQNAPLYRDLRGRAPRTPDEVRRFSSRNG